MINPMKPVLIIKNNNDNIYKNNDNINSNYSTNISNFNNSPSFHAYLFLITTIIIINAS